MAYIDTFTGNHFDADVSDGRSADDTPNARGAEELLSEVELRVAEAAEIVKEARFLNDEREDSAELVQAMLNGALALLAMTAAATGGLQRFVMDQVKREARGAA